MLMSIPRDITLSAQKYLENSDILLFIGARQAGKTTILKQLKGILEKEDNPAYFLNLEDPEYLGLLNQSPKNLFKIVSLDLKKRSFIFIDEVQYLVNPSHFLKYFYDEYNGKIKLLVSGSSAFYIDKKFTDSLAGRKKIFWVSTLSFREFLRFKDEAELAKKDFIHLSLSESEELSIYYREYMLYGGYPRVVLSQFEEKIEALREIAYSYIKKDIYEAHIRQDEVFYKLFKMLAAQIGNLVNSSELASSLGISKTAVDNYLYIMRKSFHLHLVKPFFRNMRKELTKMPKVYFSDMGLRNFFLGDFKNFDQRQDCGQLLENAVYRQLRQRYDEDAIKFWRTIQKNEVDFVVEDKKAFEVKVNPGKFREKNYKTFFSHYPDIGLSIVSLDIKDKKAIANHTLLEAWQI